MLVAIALIEKGMKYHEAVDFIRRLVVHVYLFVHKCTVHVQDIEFSFFSRFLSSKRRGAINKRQLDFLENYKSKDGKCRIM